MITATDLSTTKKTNVLLTIIIMIIMIMIILIMIINRSEELLKWARIAS